MLSLNRKTDYALVALAHLAQAEQTGGTTSARSLAQRYSLPRALLANLLKQLHQAGLIRSTRGANGGYQLAEPAERITLGRVIAATEQGPVQVAPCCSDHEHEPCEACQIERHCPITASIQHLNARFQAIFQTLTLADLMAGRVDAAMSAALQADSGSGGGRLVVERESV